MESSAASATVVEVVPGVVRQDVSFRSGGVRCAAWVYRPAGPARTAPPVVVMAHGFGGLRWLRLTAYAERFAAAGYAVLLFDYRTFGASDGAPRQVIRIRRQHEDYRAAIAFARVLPGVDPERVVLWGTSLSGGHALAVAATDPRVAAVVAQVPHVSGPASALALSPLLALRLGVHAVVDLLRAALRRDPHYVAAVGRPGSGAILSSPDAEPGWRRMQAASPERVDVRPVVAARVALAMPFYSPGRDAGRIGCPVLVQVAQDDVVTPPRAARRVAGRIRDALLMEYPGGHFDPYLGEQFDRVVADQVAFLSVKVPPR